MYKKPINIIAPKLKKNIQKIVHFTTEKKLQTQQSPTDFIQKQYRTIPTSTEI